MRSIKDLVFATEIGQRDGFFKHIGMLCCYLAAHLYVCACEVMKYIVCVCISERDQAAIVQCLQEGL